MSITKIKAKAAELREPQSERNVSGRWGREIDGSCLGCGNTRRVIVITATGWESRLCPECLYEAIRNL